MQEHLLELKGYISRWKDTLWTPFLTQRKRENHHVATALRGDTGEAAANPEPWRQGSKDLIECDILSTRSAP